MIKCGNFNYIVGDTITHKNTPGELTCTKINYQEKTIIACRNSKPHEILILPFEGIGQTYHHPFVLIMK